MHGLSRTGAGDRANRSPTPNRPGPNQPHRQIGKNQELIIEWASGHTNTYYYFVILHSSDESKLPMHTEGSLNDYINRAPASAHKFNDKRWWKVHVSCNHNYRGRERSGECRERRWNDGRRYARKIAKSEDLYIDRSAFSSESGRNYQQFEFTSAQVANDKRVEYKSDKYPWIEAVHRFQVKDRLIPREWDAARLTLPGRQGAGQYIVHMVWRGYRDALDVYVLPQPAADIYGKNGGPRWLKTEHCAYPNYKNHRNNKCFVINTADVKECLDYCNSRGTNNCQAVNVVPLKTPALVKDEIQGKEFKDAMVPWDSTGCTIPKATDVTEETFICYGFIPGTPEDPAFNAEAESIWYIRETDPEDPIFYSTCYRRETGRMFTGNPNCTPCSGAANMNLQRWQIGSRCITCADVTDWGAMSGQINKVNVWKTTDVCDKCEPQPLGSQ